MAGPGARVGSVYAEGRTPWGCVVHGIARGHGKHPGHDEHVVEVLHATRRTRPGVNPYVRMQLLGEVEGHRHSCDRRRCEARKLQNWAQRETVDRARVVDGDVLVAHELFEAQTIESRSHGERHPRSLVSASIPDPAAISNVKPSSRLIRVASSSAARRA